MRAALTKLRRETPLRRLEPVWRRLQPVYDGALNRASGGSMEFEVNGDRLRLLYVHGARWQREGYEPHVHAALMEHLRPGSVFFDVGAHIGFHTLAAAKRGAKVTAFEAAPDTAAILREHISLNGFDVDVVEAAVTDADGEIPFYFDELTMSAAITREAVDELSPQLLPAPAHEAFVRAVRLDGFGIPDLVKIDVEGAELRVLEGAPEILRSQALVLVEIHPLQLQAVGDSEERLSALVARAERSIEPIDARNPEGIYHAWLRRR